MPPIETETDHGVGLAYGFSTLFILAALHENGGGPHTAIDPGQHDWWHDIGLHEVEKVGMTDALRFINKKSMPGLAELACNGRRYDLIFIDGNHRFDNVLVDFTLSAELAGPGSYIVLDDLWMPSIRRAVSFIRNNRVDFEEVPTEVLTSVAFKRIGEDARDWKHYAEF